MTLADVRFDGYRSIIRNRLVWRGDVKCTDIETQDEFARRLRVYGVAL